MNFTLSTAAVVETVQALAAFDVLYTSSPSLSSDKSPVETSRFASLLDPDRRDLLHLAVKDSFAEIVLLLLPYVETVDFGGDDEAEAAATTTTSPSSSSASDVDESSDHSMRVGLRVPPTISRSVALLIRRRFEQAVAMRVLANVAATVGGGDSGSKGSSDDDFSARSRDAVDALIAALRSPFRPRVRVRGY